MADAELINMFEKPPRQKKLLMPYQEINDLKSDLKKSFIVVCMFK